MNKLAECEFDFLNPDFKTDTDGKAMTFSVPSELQFFLVHKTIDFLNKANDFTDSFFNFENISVADTTLRGREHFSVNINTPVGSGTIYLEYDRYSRFKEGSIVFHKGIYRNKDRYPNFYHLFYLTIKINKDMQLDSYLLRRDIRYYLEIHYEFNKDNIKSKDAVIIVTDKKYIAKKINVDNTYEFDNFFNSIIDTVVLAPNTFIELTSQFSIKKINNNESLAIFYDELRDLYEKGLLVNLENNLEVVRMAAI